MAESTTNDAPVLSAVPSALASAPGSGAATPVSLPAMDSEELEKSVKVSLADLTAKASALYLQKNYEEAAEVYAQASEMQAELNGEMSPENADILFLYGRSLFKVGQAKSDVLGTTGGEKKKPRNSAAKPKSKKTEAASSKVDATADAKTEAEKAVEEGIAEAAEATEEAGESEMKEAPPTDAKKPLFQFAGDETFEDSDDEEEAEGEEGDEEEEDDLAVAFEVLDLARVLFMKRLNAEEDGEGKGKETANGADSPTTKHIKERLADTHDLLAEISLENEKYAEAIEDGRASLNYKLDLYPKESEVIAEAHFKLSLALEFASITTTSEDATDENGPKQLDQGLRDEAAAELEKAIESTKLKLKNKEVDLAMMHVPEDNEVTRKQIAEVKDLITDMEQRLVELRKPPMDVDSVLAANNPVSGLLGTALGESASAEDKARVEEAKKNAKDLTGLVRKKAKDEKEEEKVEQKQEIAAETTTTTTTTTTTAPAPAPAANGTKRKAEDPADGETDESKKPKVEAAAAVAES